ncbi:MAG: hypothetical protein HY678_09900 [Chloroflexi bacterium]|nr:hypothetical protein [Chloroflexota bacterium]
MTDRPRTLILDDEPRGGRRQRFLGVTVTPPYLQSEGVEAVLDKLVAAGVTAIATAPMVAESVEPTASAHDSDPNFRREPPIDGGAGTVRHVTRRLWGESEVWLRFEPSYEPDPGLYHGLKYQPPAPGKLTANQGGIIRELIDAAHGRGLEVYFQLDAVLVPGLRNEDLPRLPNGELPRNRMVQTAAVASDDLRNYVVAQVRDVLRAYPDVDGLRHDWPEHPPYRLGDAFLDFGPHAKVAAERLGFDFEAMRRDALALYERLDSLSNSDLTPFLEHRSAAYELVRLLGARPGVAQALRFKAALTINYLRELRAATDQSRGRGRRAKLSPNAFPPPLSLLSGMDYAGVAEYVDSVNMKLYTMHWPLMVYFYAQELLERNSSLNERVLIRALSNLFDFEDSDLGDRLSDYFYPRPHVPHRAGVRAQARKIRQASSALAGRADLFPVVHGYGPDTDFEKRLRVAWHAGTRGIWVNRYAYLSEEKIGIIAALGNRL